MARDDAHTTVIGTSDDEEAAGWESGAEHGEPVITTRASRHLTIFKTQPRRRQGPQLQSTTVAKERTGASSREHEPGKERRPQAEPGPAEESPACQPAAELMPRRNLRTRKLSQIHPYTVEALRYRRELYANDWQDAVVSQREWRHHRIHERELAWITPDESQELPSSLQSSPPLRSSPSRSPSLTLSPPAKSPEAGSSPSDDSSPPSRASSPASSDSTDYERRFRVLKRMMPAHMARACIDDLRAMRHGDSSSESEVEHRPAPSPPHELQPGESRRRTGVHHGTPIPLLSDASSESSDDEIHPTPNAPLPDSDLRSWAVPTRPPSPTREGDAIDRMLTRTEKPRRTRARRGFGQVKSARDRSVRMPRSDRRTAPVPAWIQAAEQPRPVHHDTSRAAHRARDGVFVVEQGERVYGLPTRRADLGAQRLPYVPGPQSTLDVAREVRASVSVTLATTPRPVPRSARPAPAPAPASTHHAPKQHALPIPREWEQAPQEWHDDLQDLLAWDGARHMQLDFGIRPPPVGMTFAPHTDIARGRLHALLHVQAIEPASFLAHGHALHAWMGWDDVAPVVFAMSDDLSEPTAQDLFHFLGTWYTWQAALAQPTHGGVAIRGTFDAQTVATYLCEWAQSLLDKARSPVLVFRILWFRVSVLWRAKHAGTHFTDVSVLEGAFPLVLRLLSAVAHAAERLTDEVSDPRTEMWVCIIHLLQAVDVCAFWDVLDAALDEWLKMAPSTSLIACERAWYTLFTVCALSHFHAATGMARHTPCLDAHWPSVHRVLTRLRLRFDERVERAAPRVLLQRRDAYIHLLLRRCFCLCTQWGWPLVHADAMLTHLFDVLNAHRLADLPTETDHDFAPFLRRFDASLLYGEPSGTAFQQFLQLLGRASRDLSAADDAQRRLARLFSRMTPVRVMAFTHTCPPVSFEMAMLYNHYSLVMLFLYFEPQSALQRLRQIRSFLPFASADRSSQIACIRAVVYAGVLFRHHGLDLRPIVAWLVDVLHALQAGVRDAHTSIQTEPLGERRARQTAKELTRMMAVLVRSVQHLVRHASLHPDAPLTYPPPGLLHPAWTHELMADVAPEVANEVLDVIRVYLDTREASVAPRAAAGAGADDDSDGDDDDDDDEFDDAWMTDPGLAALLGEDASPPVDAQLAEQLHTHTSPALFQWIARGVPVCQSDETSPLERLVAHAEDDARFAAAVADWAACAHVLVYHRRRDWHAYLTLGAESWRRVSDPIRKRDVAVRFVVCMAKHDLPSFTANVTECIAIWFQCIAAYRLTEQAALTALLAEHAPAFHGVCASLDARADLIATVVQGMQTSYASSLGFVIQCISALLTSIRTYAEHCREHAYWQWCRDVVHALPLTEHVLRGVRTEMHATHAFLHV